jgi:hypothetical protein
MKDLKIKWCNTGKRPAEIYNKGLEYSLINNKLEGLHVPIRCKDFLSDVIWIEKFKKTDSIYGFTWKYGEYNLLDKKYLLMAIRDVEHNFTEKEFENLKVFLNKLDEKLNYKKTKLKFVKEGEIILGVSKEWYQVPHVWSMYLLLIRIGRFYLDYNQDIVDFIENLHTMSIYNQNDILYIKKSKHKIYKILNNTVDFSQKYEDYEEINRIHNYSGIVNFNNIDFYGDN